MKELNLEVSRLQDVLHSKIQKEEQLQKELVAAQTAHRDVSIYIYIYTVSVFNYGEHLTACFSLLGVCSINVEWLLCTNIVCIAGFFCVLDFVLAYHVYV